MIVRILGEGQYDVSDDALDRLNQLDSAVEAAVEAADEEAFSEGLARPARRRPHHRRGPRHRSLDESDLILPPADSTIDDVRELLSDDGLIPG